MAEHGEGVWSPHTLAECLDSEPLAWLTAGLALGMLFFYNVIAVLWFRSARAASPRARIVWYTLMGIFMVCSVAGYLSWIIALGAPGAASVLRIVALVAQNVLCPVFLWFAWKHQFHAFGACQRLGEEIVSHAGWIQGASDQDLLAFVRAEVENHQQSRHDWVAALSDREIAKLTRTLAGEHLRRKAEESCPTE